MMESGSVLTNVEYSLSDSSNAFFISFSSVRSLPIHTKPKCSFSLILIMDTDIKTGLNSFFLVLIVVSNVFIVPISFRFIFWNNSSSCFPVLKINSEGLPINSSFEYFSRFNALWLTSKIFFWMFNMIRKLDMVDIILSAAIAGVNTGKRYLHMP